MVTMNTSKDIKMILNEEYYNNFEKKKKDGLNRIVD